MSALLNVSRTTIHNRADELSAHDWLVIVYRAMNKKTGNFTTPYYHLFVSQSECVEFRKNYVCAVGEQIAPKAAIIERKSRKGKGGNPKLNRVNSGLHGHANLNSHGGANSGLHGHANSSSDELDSVYLDTGLPSVPSTGRKPNPVFDAVCELVFKIDPKSVTSEDGGRIGPIAAWLNGKSDGTKRNGGKVGFISHPAESEHVKRFVSWYKGQYPNANMPLDFVKFVDYWRQCATAAAKQSTVRKPAPITEFSEPTAAERAELASAMKTVRPEWEQKKAVVNE